MFYSGETTVLCLHRLAERPVPGEVVGDLGQRYQRYDVRTLNGDTSSEIFEVDVAPVCFVDSPEMQGEGPDEVFGGPSPLGPKYIYDSGDR